MVNKEDYRDFDSLINWGKYAEALEKENNQQKIVIKAYEILFEHASNKINKLKAALKDCCGKSSCAYMKIEDEYCSRENGAKHCEECLYNHYMKEVETNKILALNNEIEETTELSKNTKSINAERIEVLENSQYKLIEVVQKTESCPMDYPCAECRHAGDFDCHFTAEEWKKWSEGVLNE